MKFASRIVRGNWVSYPGVAGRLSVLFHPAGGKEGRLARQEGVGEGAQLVVAFPKFAIRREPLAVETFAKFSVLLGVFLVF